MTPETKQRIERAAHNDAHGDLMIDSIFIPAKIKGFITGYYYAEEELKEKDNQIDGLGKLYRASLNEVTRLDAAIQSQAKRIEELSAWIREMRDTAAEVGELDFPPSFFKKVDQLLNKQP